MRAKTQALLCGLALLAAAAASAQDPFGVEPQFGPVEDGRASLTVAFTVPEGHYLYAEMLEVQVPPDLTLKPADMPEGKVKVDPFLEQETEIYDHDFTFAYTIGGLTGDAVKVSVSLQGCNETLCFRPETVAYTLRPPTAAGVDAKGGPDPAPRDEPPAPTPTPLATAETPARKIIVPGEGAAPAGWTATEWNLLTEGFTVLGKESGYQKPERFLAFLDASLSGETIGLDLAKYGFWSLLAIILIGGLLLNLTPCVLPMIPINLAIIGAGAQAGS